MPSTDAQVQLAKQIADSLPEVTRNEWLQWAQLANRYGVDRAVHYAQQLSRDITVRPTVQRSSRLIAEAIGRRQPALRALDRSERTAVFGYVARFLATQTVRGSLRG